MSEGQEHYPPPQEPTPTRREQFVSKIKEFKKKKEKFEISPEERERTESGEDEVGKILYEALTREFHADPERYGVTQSTYTKVKVLKESLEESLYDADKRKPMKENMVRTLGQYVEKMYEEAGIEKPEELGEHPFETFASAAAHKGMEFYYKDARNVSEADRKDSQRLRLAVLGEHISHHTTTLASEKVVEIQQQFQERHNKFFSKVLERLDTLSGVNDEEKQALVRSFYEPADAQTNNIAERNKDVIRETTEWAEAAITDIQNDEANNELQRALKMGVKSVDRTPQEQKKLESEAWYAVRRLRKLQEQVQLSDDELSNSYGGRNQLYELTAQSDKIANLAWKIARNTDTTQLAQLQKEYIRQADRYFAARVHAYPGIKQLEEKNNGPLKAEKGERFKGPKKEPVPPEVPRQSEPRDTPERTSEKPGFAVEHYSFHQIEDMREDERKAWLKINALSEMLKTGVDRISKKPLSTSAKADLTREYQKSLLSLNTQLNAHLRNPQLDPKDPEYQRSELIKRLEKELNATNSAEDKRLLLAQLQPLLNQKHEYLESLVYRRLTSESMKKESKGIQKKTQGIENTLKELSRYPEHGEQTELSIRVFDESQKTLFAESARISKLVGTGGLDHVLFGQLENSLRKLENEIRAAPFSEKKALLIQYAQALSKKGMQVEIFRKKLEKGQLIGFRTQYTQNIQELRQPQAVQENSRSQPDRQRVRRRRSNRVDNETPTSIDTRSQPNGSIRRQPVRGARPLTILGQEQQNMPVVLRDTVPEANASISLENATSELERDKERVEDLARQEVETDSTAISVMQESLDRYFTSLDRLRDATSFNPESGFGVYWEGLLWGNEQINKFSPNGRAAESAGLNERLGRIAGNMKIETNTRLKLQLADNYRKLLRERKALLRSA